MANTIRLKRASGSDPGASDLVTGELAVRTDTAKLFTKKDDNSVAQIGGGIANVVDDSSPQLGGALGSNGNDINFADSDKAVFGSDGDLEIFHDGSDSYVQAISNGSGDLYVIANTKNIYLRPKTNENGIKIVPDGSVELYHNNNKKFETSSSGGTLTGNLAVTGTVDGRDLATDGAKLDGGIMLADGDKGDITVSNSGATFTIDTGVIANGNIASNAAIARTKLANVDVVDDSSPQLGGTLDLNGNYISVGDGGANTNQEHIRFGNDGDLRIYHDSSNSVIDNLTGELRLQTDGTMRLMTTGFVVTDEANSETIINAAADGAVELYYDNTKMFETTSSGVKLAKNCQAPLSTLTDGSTITVNFAAASHFTVTLGGNRTFGDPSNLSLSVGSSGSIFIVQDGTGSSTASFHSDYKFVGGTAPTLSTAANAVDRIDYVIRDSSTVHCAVSLDVK